MLERMESICVGVLDPLLGWILGLPSDLRLLIAAVVTSAVVVLVRMSTSNQDMLGRARNDRRRLNELIRQGRRDRDRAALRRYRRTKAEVAVRTLRYEVVPLAAAIVPVVVLAIWCFARLGYHGVGDEEAVEVVAYTPLSAVGDLMHVVPSDGLSCDAWIVEIEEDREGIGEGQEAVRGIARWQVSGAGRSTPYELVYRYRDRSFGQGLWVGCNRYSGDVVKDHGDGWGTEVRLRPVRLFGFVGGVGALMLPAWAVGYILLVIASSLLIKRVFRVY